MKCPHCGKDVDESLFPSGLTYCPYCGQNLQSSIREQVLDEISFCPYCGEELSGKTNFCPHCGKELAMHKMAYHHAQESREPVERKAGRIDIFGMKRKGGKLYKQWAEYADLPPEEIPIRQVSKDTLVRGERNEQRLRVLYMSLGVVIVILCGGLTLLLLQSC